MKTFALFTLLSIASMSVIYAQKKENFCIVKKYDNNGNLIQCDTLQIEQTKNKKKCFHYCCNEMNKDSLFLNVEKSGNFLNDSISIRLDRVFNGKNFNIWMDAFGDDFGEKFILHWESNDSLSMKFKVKKHFKNLPHDSVKKIHLEKHIKKMEEELDKIEKRLKQH